MTRFLKYILIITFCGFYSCKEHPAEKKTEKNAAKPLVICDLIKAEEVILNLPEVIVKNKMIDSLSNHKHGISLLSDSLILDGVEYYEIKAGFNSELRYETYYNFYVEKDNCQNIKIFEPILGDILSLSDWRKPEMKDKPLDLENWPYRSFVLSCGSGCAMTYSAIDLKRNSGNISVIFSVDNYIDEVLTDTFEDDFVFTFDHENSLKKITRKGEKEDFLSTQSTNSQKSFKKFAADLIQFIKK